MAYPRILLEAGNFYHIYNHGVGGRNLFCHSDNYEYFLNLYDKYITPIAETYAWVLMHNHFHLLVRMKEEADIAVSTKLTHDRVLNPVMGNDNNWSDFLSLQFAKLFNSYAQALNKRNGQHGALFERPFKRKLIDNQIYLKQLILYIHNNPVHHRFCEHAMDYPWSSYLTCISIKPTRLHREAVIGWFDNQINFKYLHNQKLEIKAIENWLEI